MIPRRRSLRSICSAARLWLASRLVTPSAAPAVHILPPGDGSRYRPLFEYLRDRHADRVALTFADVERLVGHPLPSSARLESDWWSAGDAACGHASAAADRRATVNLVSQVVVYDRISHDGRRE